MRKLLGFLLILPVGISIHLSAQDLVLEEVVVTATKKRGKCSGYRANC